MRIAIVGSRAYENRKKIKDFIFKLKQEKGNDVIIVSGGCPDGADKYAKKYALEFDMKYEEYPPSHYRYNEYCVLPHEEYDTPYSAQNYFMRNKKIAKNSDIVVGFIKLGEPSPGTDSTLRYGRRYGKKTLIIN